MKDLRRTAALYSDEIRRQLAAKVLTEQEESPAAVSLVGIFPECGKEYVQQTEALHQYSSLIGADLTVLYSREPALALLEYVKSRRITDLIISEKDAGGAVKLISQILPKVRVTTIPADSGSVFHLVAADFLCCALRRGGMAGVGQ